MEVLRAQLYLTIEGTPAQVTDAVNAIRKILPIDKVEVEEPNNDEPVVTTLDFEACAERLGFKKDITRKFFKALERPWKERRWAEAEERTGRTLRDREVSALRAPKWHSAHVVDEGVFSLPGLQTLVDRGLLEDFPGISTAGQQLVEGVITAKTAELAEAEAGPTATQS